MNHLSLYLAGLIRSAGASFADTTLGDLPDHRELAGAALQEPA